MCEGQKFFPIVFNFNPLLGAPLSDFFFNPPPLTLENCPLQIDVFRPGGGLGGGGGGGRKKINQSILPCQLPRLHILWYMHDENQLVFNYTVVTVPYSTILTGRKNVIFSSISCKKLLLNPERLNF